MKRLPSFTKPLTGRAEICRIPATARQNKRSRFPIKRILRYMVYRLQRSEGKIDFSPQQKTAVVFTSFRVSFKLRSGKHVETTAVFYFLSHPYCIQLSADSIGHSEHTHLPASSLRISRTDPHPLQRRYIRRPAYRSGSSSLRQGQDFRST